MRYTTRTIETPGTHTVDGESVDITRRRTVRVPRMPADTDRAVRRAVFAIVIVLTALSISWSTWSVSAVLGGSPMAYTVAGLFDCAWIAALGLDHLARNMPAKRTLPRNLGFVLLAVTMLVIGLHGYLQHSWMLAVVGPLVSAVAKALWWSLVHTTTPTLTEDDQAWVAAQLSRVGAQTVIAQVRRQVARQESVAALELMAMQSERDELAAALGIVFPGSADTHAVPVVDRVSSADALPAGATDRELSAASMGTTNLDGILSMVHGGTSTDVPQDEQDGSPQVSDVSTEHVAEPRHLQPVRGIATREIRNMVDAGTTDVGTIVSKLQDSGIKVPDASYIRRLVRDSRTADRADRATPYL